MFLIAIFVLDASRIICEIICLYIILLNPEIPKNVQLSVEIKYILPIV